MRFSLRNRFSSLADDCLRNVDPDDLEANRLGLLYFLFDCFREHFSVEVDRQGLLTFGRGQLDRIPDLRPGSPREWAWWNRLLDEVRANGFRIPAARVLQWIREGAVQVQETPDDEVKIAEAAEALGATMTDEGWVFLDEEDECYRFAGWDHPDEMPSLVRLWEYLHDEDDLFIAEAPIEYWLNAPWHPHFGLEVKMLNQPAGHDDAAAYLKAAGIAHTLTGRNTVLLTAATREAQWELFLAARKALAAGGGPDRSPAPLLAAAVHLADFGAPEEGQFAASLKATTWAEFRQLIDSRSGSAQNEEDDDARDDRDLEEGGDQGDGCP